MRELTKMIKVYSKSGEYLAYFSSDAPSNPENTIDMMIEPTVSIESNGSSTFTFQISLYSQKWMDIFDAENVYLVDGRKYTCLNESGIVIEDETVTVTAYETWKLLEKKYVQAYNVPKEEEFIDDQTVCLLPKSTDPLVVNGVTYTNNPYPRGSAGYNLWALLQGSGWSLKFCDVIADGFNAAEDYGVFNIETDQKDLLYNIEYVRELYGGIFEWDSVNQTLSLHDPLKWDTNYGFEVRKGKNLKSLSIDINNNIVTRLYPLGTSNLNIAAVNGNKRYIDNFSYTNTIYEMNLQNSDIYDQKQLKYWGEKELSEICRPRKTVSAEIVDLRTVPGREYETFDINDIATVVYTEGKEQRIVKEQLRIISWSYNVFDPSNASIELGDKKKDVIDFLKQAYDAGNVSDSVIDENGHISIDDIWDYGYGDYGGCYDDTVNDYIHQSEHRLEILINDVEGSLADFIVEANETFATIEALVQFETETTQAIAGLKIYADSTFATVTSLAEFRTQTSAALTSIEQYVDSLEARVTLQAQYITENSNNIARIELIADQNRSQINLVADEVRVQGNLIAQKADIEDLRVTNLEVETINGWKVTATSTLKAHSDSIYAAFDRIKVTEADIRTLKATMITTESLKSKNISTAGLTTGNLSADAANFGSCTVRGNLNCGTLNGWDLVIRRVSGPAGDYDGVVVG